MYTRLSPNPKKADTVNQESDLKEFAKRNGWEISTHYKDIHISGSKTAKDRPEFKRMLEDARQRKFDMLLFWSLDRLSREGVSETLGYLNLLNSYGINYKSYTEQYLDSCGIFKDAIIAIMATLAKQERVRIIERTLIGQATAKAKGVRFGRPRAVVDRLRVAEMRREGKSLSEVAKVFGVNASTISRLIGKKEVPKNILQETE